MRNVFYFTTSDEDLLVEKLLRYSSREEYFTFLDSNGVRDAYSRYEWITAFGAKHLFNPEKGDYFDKLFHFHQTHRDWLFGHLNYDLKNSLEKLESRNKDLLSFSPLLFFVPETVIYKKDGLIHVESYIWSSSEELDFALKTENTEFTSHNISLKARTTKDEYLQNVKSLKEHLQHGNIYEINYCIEFFNKALMDPVSIFMQLNKAAAAPFSAFYKTGDQHLICASPERFMLKNDDVLISQPIKGTARRAQNPAEDQQLREQLYNDPKERSENVMIVDLVRNDLSRTARKASVKVEELYGIYTYPSVHQMISTVRSQLDPKHHFANALKYAFPMGSMTGAPKVKAMELIDEHENFSRSLYSGSVGYITPQADFDFNVVIRSLFYNTTTQYLSARVGSAITIHCQAEKEYEECLVKAEGLFKALSV